MHGADSDARIRADTHNDTAACTYVGGHTCSDAHSRAPLDAHWHVHSHASASTDRRDTYHRLCSHPST
jgi:hypothetical protein